MKRKVVSVLLVAAMTMGVLAGCGSSSKSSDAKASSVNNEKEGKVINIYVWNEEFQSRLNDYYSEVEKVSDDKSITYLKDGTEIHWTVNPNQNGVYQDKLDQALKKQDSASTDDKVDMYLVEADYALKYTDANANVSVPLKDLGITDDDLSDQYQYTKDVVTDANGEIRGTSWQATPGLFAYRRSIAKKVFGTDDPDKVQEKLADWNKFDEAAKEMKDNGYFMLSSVADTFRVFSNNVSGKWVDGTTVKVDKNLMNWVDQSKKYTDEGLNHNVSGQWTDEWNKDQAADSKVFGFFYSTWGINFTLQDNAGKEGAGDWAVCDGPQPFYWGGSWLVAANGTDNPKHLKDIMLQLTANKDNLVKITKDTQDYTNTQTGMQELASDPKYGSDFLGGQNHIKLFAEVAPTIDMSNISPYDQGCGEVFQNSFGDYFNGKIDEEKAKENFETAIKERYPELTDVEWP
ncbi:MAG: ABC transporter substrate-binding protein [Lachnospiraceae bacterium]|nr:ABC transporter substrate-binding protein [Lachnospiraceae bacterium]